MILSFYFHIMKKVSPIGTFKSISLIFLTLLMTPLVYIFLMHLHFIASFFTVPAGIIIAPLWHYREQNFLSNLLAVSGKAPSLLAGAGPLEGGVDFDNLWWIGKSWELQVCL